MLIIGEKINTVNKNVAVALKNRDKTYFQYLASAQIDSGIVDVIDVNVGLDADLEPAYMKWMVSCVEEVTANKVPLSIDSSSPKAIIAGIERLKNKEGAFINSITIEEGRHKDLLPLAKEYGLNIIALPIDSRGIPQSAENRLKNAAKIVDLIMSYDISLSNLYIDCIVEPISLACDKARISLDTVKKVKKYIPEVKTFICLTAISFGLPDRKLINRNFLSLLLREGIDSIILDPLDKALIETLFATELLLGEDEYCQDYLDLFRKK
jgi:5-methyltetrahydrofolate--homocysteine methyltransferase